MNVSQNEPEGRQPAVGRSPQAAGAVAWVSLLEPQQETDTLPEQEDPPLGLDLATCPRALERLIVCNNKYPKECSTEAETKCLSNYPRSLLLVGQRYIRNEYSS